MTDRLRLFDASKTQRIGKTASLVGNADEMRIYAVASTQERANEIADLGVLPNGGIIHSLAAAVAL